MPEPTQAPERPELPRVIEVGARFRGLVLLCESARIDGRVEGRVDAGPEDRDEARDEQRQPRDATDDAAGAEPVGVLADDGGLGVLLLDLFWMVGAHVVSFGEHQKLYPRFRLPAIDF